MYLSGSASRARRVLQVSMLSSWIGSACGCVRWIGMPELPKGSANDTALYGVSKRQWGDNVNRARKVVRKPEAGFKWLLAGTAGERLVRVNEVREAFAGVIFVGDSQIREVAWAGLKLLAPAEDLRFNEADGVFAAGRGGKRNVELQGSCVPQSVGKTGFTATCSGGVCRMHSPFHNKSHAEYMRRLLLTRPHDWDGSLSLHADACTSDFFFSYQATWGAIPVKPLTLPRCLHPRSADDTFGVTRPDGSRKPVLWIMDGGGLHEMEYCDPRRWTLPQVQSAPPNCHPRGPRGATPLDDAVRRLAHSRRPRPRVAGGALALHRARAAPDRRVAARGWRLHDACVQAVQGRGAPHGALEPLASSGARLAIATHTPERRARPQCAAIEPEMVARLETKYLDSRGVCSPPLAVVPLAHATHAARARTLPGPLTPRQQPPPPPLRLTPSNPRHYIPPPVSTSPTPPHPR